MTDEERLRKLTELAQRVWPNRRLFIEEDGSAAVLETNFMAPLAMIVEHPHALDALEAALSVLAGLDPYGPLVRANVELGLSNTNMRVALINIRNMIKSRVLDARPFDDHERELGVLRNVVRTAFTIAEAMIGERDGRG